MYSAWLRSTFLRVLEFLQIKDVGPNFWGEPILQNVWIIWSPLLYFNFKSFLDPNSSPCISFQCLFYDSGLLRSGLWNFSKLKRGDLISRGNQFCRISKLFCHPPPPPLLYFNFKSFLDLNSLSFIRFQCILYDSGLLFSGFSNLYKLKTGDLISGANQFCRMSELFGPTFCFSILKVF